MSVTLSLPTSYFGAPTCSACPPLPPLPPQAPACFEALEATIAAALAAATYSSTPFADEKSFRTKSSSFL